VPPIIGITSSVEQVRWGVWDTMATLLPHRYVDAITRAGGRPIVLPPSVEAVERTLDALEGLLLSGGADISPDRYGEAPHPQTTGIRPDRDAAELALFAGAMARGLPVLGVCRGMQLMVVACGGRLHQHLPDAVGHDGHRPAPGRYGDHLVTTAAGSRLRKLLGERVDVRSYHHQGIAETGDRLIPTAWAEDGTVEAVEQPDRRFALGVLWHPEAGEDLRLFLALVAAAIENGDAARAPESAPSSTYDPAGSSQNGLANAIERPSAT